MFIDFAAAFRFALGTPLTASDDRGADEKGPASTARDTVAFFFIRSVLGAGPGGRPDEGAASFVALLVPMSRSLKYYFQCLSLLRMKMKRKRKLEWLNLERSRRLKRSVATMHP